MKALVLCGGLPQLELVHQLQERGIFTILADMNENALAVKDADKFYKVSTLDVNGLRKVAIDEQVDFLITVCADQMMVPIAKISEELNLPCYLDYQTALDVSSKQLMKEIFVKNGIPTSKHVITDHLTPDVVEELEYPLIVKPTDSYSSRGVKKVNSYSELEIAFETALDISREKKVIIEEFVDGDELTVDCYVENGVNHVLCISRIDKIPDPGKFVICRTVYPAEIDEETREAVEKAAKSIADAFGLKDSPMLIQLKPSSKGIRVLEFCARTGGGMKYKMIKDATGFDVVKAVIDLTVGEKHHVEELTTGPCRINEFLYCKPGKLDHMEGLQELLDEGTIDDYSIYKPDGYEFGDIKSSGDRVGYFLVTGSRGEIQKKQKIARERIKAVSVEGTDFLRHDICEMFG